MKFRGDYHLGNDWPIPVSHIVLFLSFCFEKGMSGRSITTYLAGVNYFHMLQGFPDLNQLFIVTKVLEGCRRGRVTFDKRAPLTKSVLLDICDKLPIVCYDVYEAKLFSALFTLAYFGLFRVSELTVSTPLQTTLQISDVSFCRNGQAVVICLRHYKTNQKGKPVFIKLPEQKGDICPVRNLREFLELRPKCYALLFCHKNGTVVTRSQFTHVLSRAIGLTRYQSGHFRSHSFRIGRATDLSIQGCPPETIMKMGRWSSQCYKLYIRH